MPWYRNWEFWLAGFTAIAAVVQAIAAWFIFRLERTIESARQVVDLHVTLGKGAWGEEGEQLHNQDWIEVINCSHTGVRVIAVTIEANRIGGQTCKTTEPLNELMNPFSTKRINIHVPMCRVVSPLDPKLLEPIPVNGRVRITLRYRAFGKERSSEFYEFNGEIRYGEFDERQGPSKVEVGQPDP